MCGFIGIKLTFDLGTNWVDIFYWVPNPSIWMRHLPVPSTNQVHET